jgi:predicted nucleic acid-binding protein
VLYYLDSSALVKLYIREAGTERMLALAARKAGHQLVVLALAQVELRLAFRRRQRAGEMGDQLADELLAAFQRHLESKFVRQALPMRFSTLHANCWISTGSPLSTLSNWPGISL